MAEVRLAYLVSRFPKLTETFVLYEVLELRRQGLSVDLYPLRRQQNTVTHPEIESLQEAIYHGPLLSPAVLVANLQTLFRHPRRFLGALAKVLGGTWGSRRFFLGALAFFPRSVYLARQMERHGITHIHAHFASHPALAAFIIHHLTDLPFSFTAHGSDIHKDTRMLAQKAQAADFLVTISQYNRRFLLERCGMELADKIRVIHCGIDPHTFQPTPPPPEPPFRVVCVAALRTVKGHRHLIGACARVRARGVNLHLDLIGAGPRRAALEKYIQALGLTSHVTLHGGLPRPRVAEWMARAQVVALTSIMGPQGEREGIPVVLMEAMASGRPVLSSHLSGIPELVEDGVNGLLAPPGDEATLAQALERLASDPDLRQRLAAAGREKVLRKFDLQQNTHRLARLFTGPLRAEKVTTRAPVWGLFRKTP